MKKIIIAFAALATIAACNKAEVVETPKGDAIAFGDAFVDNATKAIYEDADDIDEFTVWGNVKGTNTDPLALYPEGATVTRGSAGLGEAWTCTVARYWTPLATYNFVAIANGTVTTLEKGIPTKIEYAIDPDTPPADLIYGATPAATNESAVPTSGVNTNNVVTFTMQHLLARVKVSFENQIEEDDYTYAISNVTLSTWDKGVYTIGKATPWEREGEGTAALPYTGLDALASGATHDAGAQLVIPGADATLAFRYNLQLNGTTIYTKDVTHTVSDLEQGHSYSLNVKLSAGNKIDFTLTSTGLAGWGDDTTQDI